MDIYGLTGGIGAGKTAVADLLQEYGIPVVSADELSRMVVAKGSEGLGQVVEAFGEAILDPRGELDRRAMARVVFSDAEKRRRLEAILHPLIRERYETVLDAIEKSGHEHVVYEVPLLFEKNLQGDMKAVVLVTASEATRLRRVRARDGSTEHDVRARMAAQMDEDEKRRRADYVLYNEGNLDDLRREVELLLSRFMKIPPRRPAAKPAADEPTTPSKVGAEAAALRPAAPPSTPTPPTSAGTPAPPPPPGGPASPASEENAAAPEVAPPPPPGAGAGARPAPPPPPQSAPARTIAPGGAVPPPPPVGGKARS